MSCQKTYKFILFSICHVKNLGLYHVARSKSKRPSGLVCTVRLCTPSLCQKTCILHCFLHIFLYMFILFFYRKHLWIYRFFDMTYRKQYEFIGFLTWYIENTYFYMVFCMFYIFLCVFFFCILIYFLCIVSTIFNHFR